MPFQIKWSLADEEWDLALETYRIEPAGGLYDGSRGALYHLLRGMIQMQQDDELLFPEQLLRAFDDLGGQIPDANGSVPYREAEELKKGVTLSLADVGYQFIHNASRKNFRSLEDGASIRYVQRNGDLVIYFKKSGDSVNISSNRFVDIGVLPENHMIVVDRSEFFFEVDMFLSDLSTALSQFVPGLLRWDTFAKFSDYSMLA